MNREEALNKIGELVVYARAQGWDEEFTEAFETLFTECEDAVSRETVLNTIKKVCFSREQKWVDFRVSYGSNGQRDFISKFIESLPSVTPTCLEKPNNCEDVISRQAVTDAIADTIVNGESLGYSLAEEIVSEIPSVASKVTECEDCISRKAVETLLEKYSVHRAGWYTFGYQMTKELNQLPSVIPKVVECEDCISRADMLGAVRHGTMYTSEAVQNIVDSLPSVNPKQKMGHCKDCKYFEHDSVANVNGVPLIVAHEICSKWGRGCKTDEDGYCFLFESQESEEN